MERRERFEDDMIALSAREPIAIASTTAAEILTGSELSLNPARRDRAHLMTEALLRHVPTLPFDLEAARIYARLYAHLQARGHRVGGFDLQIASIALAHQCSVVTLNLREFNRIPGLTVIAPEWAM